MVAEGNVGLAFGLVTLAGCTSMIGAASLFFASQTNPKLLAASLGFAAGLMVFVSLSEILAVGSIGNFESAGWSEGAAIRASIALFMAGCALIFLTDKLVHFVSPYKSMPMLVARKSWARIRSFPAMRAKSLTEIKGSIADGEEAVTALDDNDLESGDASGASTPPTELDEDPKIAVAPSIELELVASDASKQSKQLPQNRRVAGGEPQAGAAANLFFLQTTSRLKRMSVLVAISLAVHNFPEGIAVFIGALRDSTFGASIAIAIAMHNIPEGLCICLPVYYATGSKRKAFFWTLIPSLAEPLGGLFAYLVIDNPSDAAFGVAFGVIAGMMVWVAVMELLPMAFRYDPKNKVVTGSCMVGMAAMGVSLILLTL